MKVFNFSAFANLAKQIKSLSPKVWIPTVVLVVVFAGAYTWLLSASSNLNVSHRNNVLTANNTGLLGNGGANVASSGSSNSATGSSSNSKSSSKSKGSNGNTQKQGTGSGQNQSATSDELILSTYNVTLGNSLADPNSGSVDITFSSNAGPIDQPTQSPSQLDTVVKMGVTQLATPTVFQNQWTFTLARESVPNGGTDIKTFTAKTQSGKTITAQLKITVVQIPTLTVQQGSLDKVTNSDGTNTITAHFTIVPSANFGNPTIHVCDDTAYVGGPGDSCNPQDSYSVTYNGNNNLSVTETVPSTDHSLKVAITADGVYGYYNLPWSF